jgi:hypothetical protein
LQARNVSGLQNLVSNPGGSRRLKIHAYVLAADPTWLSTSVRAYYAHVDKLIACYDADGRGWTGAPIQIEACLRALRSLDDEAKIEWVAGRFSQDESSVGESLLEAETRQRRSALEAASVDADWVLQIDTDEVLPGGDALLDALEAADRLGVPAVEWPMRILYRRLRDGRFLEVVGSRGKVHFEYPGPIAVRAGTQLMHCRRGSGPFLRPIVIGDSLSPQVARAPEAGEHRVELAPEAAIWHNSWARSPEAMRRKIASWGHNQGVKSWIYYYIKWLPAPVTWRALRDFHPLYPSLWPRLAFAPDPPFDVIASDNEQ